MKPKAPPHLADRLLKLFCKDSVIETLQGDLHELYQSRLEQNGKFKADLLYYFDVADSCRPFAFTRKSKSKNSNTIAMFNNYLKVAWRNLFKHGMYSAIKIGGFAIGITAFLLIALFVRDEVSYDAYYEHQDRIFRVLNVSEDPNEPGRWPAFPPQAAQVIRDQFPEVELVGRLLPYNGWWDAGDNQFRREDQKQNTYEEGFAYLDNEVLEILEIPMVYGQRKQALAQPYSLVISKTKAEKYFPNQDPVGKTVILNDDEETPYLIGGVMEDFPSNSHLQFDFFITLTAREFWPGEQTDWCCWNYNPYVRLKPGADPAELEEKLVVLMDDYILPSRRERGRADADEMAEYHSFGLQPVSDIHLKSADVYDPVTRGDIRIVWLFVAIAGFVLALACINFINLSTAKSANRAKEVGMRKVVGSGRGNLIQQFLTESLMFSTISVALGLLLTWLLLPMFNQLAEKSLTLPWEVWWLAPLIIGFILVIGLLAGLYPSFYLSAFRPIEVLKGSLSRGSKSSKLRSGMVIFQFTTSIVLIVGALVVQRQMDFILNKKLGFDKDQVVMIQGINTLGERIPVFKEEILKLANVQNAAVSDFLPITGTSRNGNSFWIEGRDKIDKGVSGQRWDVDKDYIATMGMKLIEGRDFTDNTSDNNAIIINQSMVKELGLKEPLGTRMFNGDSWIVIGVIEDFHFESMKKDIEPLTLVRNSGSFDAAFGSVMSVKINDDDILATMEVITSKWDDLMPDQHIRYDFLDESFARMYEDVERTGNVFTAFSILAIIVACLGLFGLSAFMVEQRSKEISIRKVLGASLQEIFKLLTLNFAKMVMVSLVVAVPLGYYLMQQWLADYKYSIPIGWDVFVIAGFTVLVIAMVTVSYESVKAAVVNPTKGLRSE